MAKFPNNEHEIPPKTGCKMKTTIINYICHLACIAAALFMAYHTGKIIAHSEMIEHRTKQEIEMQVWNHV